MAVKRVPSHALNLSCSGLWGSGLLGGPPPRHACRVCILFHLIDLVSQRHSGPPYPARVGEERAAQGHHVRVAAANDFVGVTRRVD